MEVEKTPAELVEGITTVYDEYNKINIWISVWGKCRLKTVCILNLFQGLLGTKPTTQMLVNSLMEDIEES